MGPITILTVDDSPSMRALLKHALVGQGHVVHDAEDGLIALDWLNRHIPDLVITDINMPNMDGLEMLGKIKSMDAYKSVPVIMITTEGNQNKVMEAVSLGAAGYVRKPFTTEQIKEKLTGLV